MMADAQRNFQFATLGFEFDYRTLQRQLDGVARDVMPQAAARFLNKVAFEARDQLKKEVNRAFDKPVKFTRDAFRVSYANEMAGEHMFSSVEVMDEQAKYLAFQIFGGERGAGDAGSGKYDVFAHSDKLTRAGGVDRGYLKRLGERNRKEKSERKQLRAQRPALKERRMWDMNQYSPEEYRPLTWVEKSRNKPGIFFGEVGGLKGYWERPKRTKVSKHRKKGVISVKPSGNNRPRLLMAMKDSVSYRPLMKYDYAVMEAWRIKGTKFWWDKALKHEVAKYDSEVRRGVLRGRK
jgi:hypothetical protein